MEIVDYIVENVSFFVRGEIPYYYEHGVFIEDTKGVKLKYRIQKLIYWDQVNSSTIQRVYNLLITQPQIYRNSYELNRQPAHWINFKNAYYDVLAGELIEHDLKYMTINYIPFPYYPEDRGKVLKGGANIHTGQGGIADVLGVFRILYDYGYTVPEIFDAERKWGYRKVCCSCTDPACNRE